MAVTLAAAALSTSAGAQSTAGSSEPSGPTALVTAGATERIHGGAVAVPAARARSHAGAVAAHGAEPSAVPTETPAPTEPVPPIGSPSVVARYGFDQGSAVVTDLSGHGNTLRIRTGNGGKVRLVKRAPGRAIAFPRKCRSGNCARVVLQAPNAAELNPGTRPFSFGATVRLARKQTTNGQNVLQKGYSARGQYKLQIDGVAGKPSCVLVGQSRPKARYLVKSPVTVADRRWHRIECRRSSAALTISVDGIIRGVIAVPVDLSVANTAPLSLGGKGGSQRNDQYQGAVDDVWVAVG